MLSVFFFLFCISYYLIKGNVYYIFLPKACWSWKIGDAEVIRKIRNRTVDIAQGVRIQRCRIISVVGESVRQRFAPAAQGNRWRSWIGCRERSEGEDTYFLSGFDWPTWLSVHRKYKICLGNLRIFIVIVAENILQPNKTLCSQWILFKFIIIQRSHGCR